MEIRRFCLLRKTAGFLLQKYFSFEIPDRNRQQLLEKMQLCKKIPLKYWTLYLIHKALNHESFCKQKHYHKLRLTDHCWFKWQPFLAMSQSARQESCSTQVTSGQLYGPTVIESSEFSWDNGSIIRWRGIIHSHPSHMCYHKDLCSKTLEGQKFVDEIQRLKMGILVKISL